MNPETRPWGSFYTIDEQPQYKIKHLTIKPKQRISLQSHDRRSEHWIIVSGSGWALVGVSMLRVVVGMHVHIPKGYTHRLTNDGEEDLIVVEVQTGEYFGEDDIKRYSDDYGRK